METAPRFAPAPHRVLLVEDDPVSQHYLVAVLEGLGLTVDLAGDARQARALAGAGRHTLWMIDVNLPDSTGPALLAELRLAHGDVPALAHTADRSPELARTLHRSGFADVLVKPFVRARLQEVLQPWLPLQAPSAASIAEELPVWDDARALSALNGQQDHITMLRGLFLGELPAIRRLLEEAGQPDAATDLGPHLHRLRASCGFVGASRLDHATRALQSDPADPDCRRQVLAAIDDLLPA